MKIAGYVTTRGTGSLLARFPMWAKGLLPLAGLLVVLGLSAGCAQTSSTTAQVPTPPAAPAPTSAATEPNSEPAPTTPVAPDPEPSSAVKVLEAIVTRIIDGDTVEMRLDGGTTEKVRFIGVDTPEDTKEHEPYGAEATAFTTAALAGKTVFLEMDVGERDKYGRLLAYVWLKAPTAAGDAEMRASLFNARLLTGGYAQLMTIPPNVKYVDSFTKYAAEARESDLGLWALRAPAPAPAPPPVAAPSPAPTPAPTTAYIGNRNTMKFHYASCGSVDQMNPSNKVPMSSRDQAIAGGYVPCKNCNP